MKSDETEPWVLPHFKACHGPCEQGRLPCPCPMACEEAEESISPAWSIVVGIVVVFAVIGFGAVVGLYWR